MGYLNDEVKTKETIDDEGWLHSGDIGKVDDDGFLYVTGRIKGLLEYTRYCAVCVILSNNYRADHHEWWGEHCPCSHRKPC